MLFRKNKNSRPHNWLIHHHCISAVKKNEHLLKGRILDIGCGTKPYASIITPLCDRYIGVEHSISPHGHREADILADALSLPFREKSFNAVVSFQVMEHVPEPGAFLAEAFRVLENGGTMLITTPFLWGEHEAPHDYYRFTRYGLKYLSEQAGFKILSIDADTRFWSAMVLRLNYRLNGISALRPLFYPFFLIGQTLAYFMDRADRSYTADTATFTTVLLKP